MSNVMNVLPANLLCFFAHSAGPFQERAFFFSILFSCFIIVCLVLLFVLYLSCTVLWTSWRVTLVPWFSQVMDNHITTSHFASYVLYCFLLNAPNSIAFPVPLKFKFRYQDCHCTYFWNKDMLYIGIMVAILKNARNFRQGDPIFGSISKYIQ